MKHSGMLWQGNFQEGLTYCREKYGEPTGIIINDKSVAPTTDLPITINRNIQRGSILFGLPTKNEPSNLSTAD